MVFGRMYRLLYTVPMYITQKKRGNGKEDEILAGVGSSTKAPLTMISVNGERIRNITEH
jgi:hypothetical protein